MQPILHTTLHHFFAALTYHLSQIFVSSPMANRFRSIVSGILSKIAAILLAFAKCLHTSESRLSKCNIYSSDSATTKAGVKEKTESIIEPSQKVDVPIQASSDAMGKEGQAEKSQSTVISMNSLPEVIITPTAIPSPGSGTIIKAPAASASHNPSLPIEIHRPTTTSTNTRPVSRNPFLARRKSSSLQPVSSPKIQCTCPNKYPRHILCHGSHKPRPVQSAGDSPAQHQSRVTRWETHNEFQRDHRGANGEYSLFHRASTRPHQRPMAHHDPRRGVMSYPLLSR